MTSRFHVEALLIQPGRNAIARAAGFVPSRTKSPRQPIPPGATILSRAEQATLAGDLSRAADLVRASKGQGARVLFWEAGDAYERKVINTLNAVQERGSHLLSRAEVARIHDPDLRARVERLL